MLRLKIIRLAHQIDILTVVLRGITLQRKQVTPKLNGLSSEETIFSHGNFFQLSGSDTHVYYLHNCGHLYA